MAPSITSPNQNPVPQVDASVGAAPQTLQPAAAAAPAQPVVSAPAVAAPAAPLNSASYPPIDITAFNKVNMGGFCSTPAETKGQGSGLAGRKIHDFLIEKSDLSIAYKKGSNEACDVTFQRPKTADEIAIDQAKIAQENQARQAAGQELLPNRVDPNKAISLEKLREEIMDALITDIDGDGEITLDEIQALFADPTYGPVLKELGMTPATYYQYISQLKTQRYEPIYERMKVLSARRQWVPTVALADVYLQGLYQEDMRAAHAYLQFNGAAKALGNATIGPIVGVLSLPYRWATDDHEQSEYATFTPFDQLCSDLATNKYAEGARALFFLQEAINRGREQGAEWFLNQDVAGAIEFMKKELGGEGGFNQEHLDEAAEFLSNNEDFPLKTLHEILTKQDRALDQLVAVIEAGAKDGEAWVEEKDIQGALKALKALGTNEAKKAHAVLTDDEIFSTQELAKLFEGEEALYPKLDPMYRELMDFAMGDRPSTLGVSGGNSKDRNYFYQLLLRPNLYFATYVFQMVAREAQDDALKNESQTTLTDVQGDVAEKWSGAIGNFFLKSEIGWKKFWNDEGDEDYERKKLAIEKLEAGVSDEWPDEAHLQWQGDLGGLLLWGAVGGYKITPAIRDVSSMGLKMFSPTALFKYLRPMWFDGVGKRHLIPGFNLAGGYRVWRNIGNPRLREAMKGGIARHEWGGPWKYIDPAAKRISDKFGLGVDALKRGGQAVAKGADAVTLGGASLFGRGVKKLAQVTTPFQKIFVGLTTSFMAHGLLSQSYNERIAVIQQDLAYFLANKLSDEQLKEVDKKARGRIGIEEDEEFKDDTQRRAYESARANAIQEVLNESEEEGELGDEQRGLARHTRRIIGEENDGTMPYDRTTSLHRLTQDNSGDAILEKAVADTLTPERQESLKASLKKVKAAQTARAQANPLLGR